MLRFAYDFSQRRVAIAVACFSLISAGFALGADGGSSIPDFSSFNDGWVAINSDFTPVPGSGPQPVTYDRKFPFRRNDEPGPATYRVADLDNPNLQPWAIAELKNYNDKVHPADLEPTPRCTSLPVAV